LEFGLAQLTAPVQIRIRYGVHAAKVALQLDDADRAVALSKEVLGFLPTVHYPLKDRSNIEYTLKSLQGFDAIAAAAVLKAGYPAARAIESNEAARGVIAKLTLLEMEKSDVSSNDRLYYTRLTEQRLDPKAGPKGARCDRNLTSHDHHRLRGFRFRMLCYYPPKWQDPPHRAP
jgi:hypothetical protein